MLALVKCPVCRMRMSGSEPEDEPCPRCQSELRLLRKTYALARYYQSRARRALGENDAALAVCLSRRACTYVCKPETRETLCAALAAVGQLEAAHSLLENS
jgi:hypothetical protein